MGLWSWLMGKTRSPEDEKWAEFSDDDFSRLALDIVFPRVVRYPYSADEIKQAEEALAGLRAEYASTKPQQLRRHVMNWCRYYERHIVDARRDLAERERDARMRKRFDELRSSP